MGNVIGKILIGGIGGTGGTGGTFGILGIGDIE